MYAKALRFFSRGRTSQWLGAVLILATAFLSCGKSPTDAGVDVRVESTAKKVRSLESDFPRIFDATGCLDGTGNQMEMWMGAGDPSGAVLVGYVTFVDGIPGRPGQIIIDFTDGGDAGSEPDLYPYIASEISIHFADNWEDIPGAQKKGGLIPGQFDYKILPTQPNQTRFEIYLPTPDYSISTFLKFGAIHAAGVIHGGMEGFDYWLPDTPVTITVTRISSTQDMADIPVVASYMEFNINDPNGDFIDGHYEGWCVDTDHGISTGVVYDAMIYSSYDPDLTTLMLVDKPTNFGAVNYLLNSFSVGMVLNYNWNGTDYSRRLRFGDIQLAIWYLIDNTAMGTYPPNGALGRVSLSAAQYLATEALKHTDFVPTSGQRIAFVVQPTLAGAPAQIVIGTLNAPGVTTSGTAWADGKEGFSPGNSWATIFQLKEN